MFRDNPPTASFRTTTGRTFRVIKVDDNFCVAIAAEAYDPRITEKLMQMHREGAKLQEAALQGLNNLTMLEKARLFNKDRDLSELSENFDRMMELEE